MKRHLLVMTELRIAVLDRQRELSRQEPRLNCLRRGGVTTAGKAFTENKKL